MYLLAKHTVQSKHHASFTHPGSGTQRKCSSSHLVCGGSCQLSSDVGLSSCIWPQLPWHLGTLHCIALTEDLLRKYIYTDVMQNSALTVYGAMATQTAVLTLWWDSLLYQTLSMFLGFGLPTADHSTAGELNEAQDQQDASKETNEPMGPNRLQDEQHKSNGDWRRIVHCRRLSQLRALHLLVIALCG